MNKRTKLYIRKSHRWLGLIIGVQFLLWTLGGFYFAWNDIRKVRGDTERAIPSIFSAGIELISPSIPIGVLCSHHNLDSIRSVQLIDILGNPHYQIVAMQHAKTLNFLADAITGDPRPALTKEESIRIAQSHFKGNPEFMDAIYLTETNTHHEYRGSPLPAWAITFDHPTNTTVYVSTELGTVQKFRNDRWRIFDFLWMLHTMDYKSRDNFGNILLKAFSGLGIITIASGFLLFFTSGTRPKSNQ